MHPGYSLLDVAIAAITISSSCFLLSGVNLKASPEMTRGPWARTVTRGRLEDAFTDPGRKRRNQHGVNLAEAYWSRVSPGLLPGHGPWGGPWVPGTGRGVENRGRLLARPSTIMMNWKVVEPSWCERVGNLTKVQTTAVPRPSSLAHAMGPAQRPSDSTPKSHLSDRVSDHAPT